MLRSTKYNYEDNIVYGSILFPKGEMGQYICFNGFLFFYTVSLYVAHAGLEHVIFLPHLECNRHANMFGLNVCLKD